MSRSRALFLDRDGTLIHDVGYPRNPASVELLPDVVDALRTAQELGFRLVIISNQSGVARGIIQPVEARAVQARVEELFAARGIAFDGAFFCFHGPDDGCACRKPAPGMIVEAASALELSLSTSIMIGDKHSDIDAGIAAGCRSIAFGALDHPGALGRVSSWAELETRLRGLAAKS